MKTLDEVIEYFNNQCKMRHVYLTEDADARFAEALHYLKEYREEIKNIRYFHDEYIALNNELADLKNNENPPLTWDELKAMTGKPVWIEAESLSVGVSPYWKDWYIIKSFSNDEFMYCNDGFEWAKEMQGRLWQAYRKERK